MRLHPSGPEFAAQWMRNSEESDIHESLRERAAPKDPCEPDFRAQRKSRTSRRNSRERKPVDLSSGPLLLHSIHQEPQATPDAIRTDSGIAMQRKGAALT